MPVRFAPVMRIFVPPVFSPLLGLTEEIVGGWIGVGKLTCEKPDGAKAAKAKRQARKEVDRGRILTPAP
jgi:hypothetical protein